MTLPEVLVMMIVAGVVFLGVMDGLGLFRRYALQTAGQLTGNTEFYDGYYRLEDIAASADSLTGSKYKVHCWKDGTQNAILILQDSALVAEYGAVGDTLIRRVGRMEVYRGKEPSRAFDSLKIVVSLGEGETEISFTASVPAQVAAKQSITEVEKDYEYK